MHGVVDKRMTEMETDALRRELAEVMSFVDFYLHLLNQYTVS